MIPFIIVIVMVFIANCAFDFVTLGKILWLANLLFTLCVAIIVGTVILMINIHA